VSVIGSSGAAYADDHQNSQLLYRGGPPQAFQAGEGTRHLAVMIQEFVDAIATNKDLSPTVTAWRSVLSVVDAVRQSLVAHRAIDWKGA
jgi:predicted dehydrogenase